MNEILLDTNAYTRYLSGDKKVLDVIAAAEIVYMSVFVLGEFLPVSREEIRRNRIYKFLDLFLKSRRYLFLRQL